MQDIFQFIYLILKIEEKKLNKIIDVISYNISDMSLICNG